MKTRANFLKLLAATAAISALTLSVSADDLRNVKRGEALPACKLAGIDGSVVDSSALRGSVVVYVCLSAEQRRSELAAAESQQVVDIFTGEPVKLIHVTADVIHKDYFQTLRQEKHISANLAFDADRAFYGRLGLIAFPTTIIVNRDGNLDNVISLHGSDYKTLLDAHIRHALGKINDEELQSLLAAKPTESASPRSAASAHRSLARLMREKGSLDQAKAELAKGLELDPGNREIMLDLADIDIALADYPGAETMIAGVLQAQPDHRRAKQLKGVCLFYQGRLDEAQAILLDALNLNPSPEVIHYYLGMIYEQTGKQDLALEHYREAARGLIRAPVPPANPGSSEQPNTASK